MKTQQRQAALAALRPSPRPQHAMMQPTASRERVTIARQQRR